MDNCRRLEELYSRIQKDSAYRNNRMGSAFVPGKGSCCRPSVVLIGEAPGRREEIAGEPFVGAAGRNLDILLHRVGLLRDEIFITNVIKYRPVSSEGKNRNPSLSESRRALPYLLEELAILSPKLTVCLGFCPARTLLGGNPVMGEINGLVFQRDRMDIMVTYHPSPFNFMIARKRDQMFKAFEAIKDLLATDSVLGRRPL